MSVHAGAVVPPPEPREIRGPSALGGDWRRFIHLTWLIAVTEFRLTYFGSVLGYLWSLMRPLLFFGVLYLVFAEIANFGAKIPYYPVLLLTNIVLISFFQEATGAAVTAVVNRENLVRKMHFPRMVIPLSIVLTSSMNLGLNLIAVFAFILIYGVPVQATWLLLPVLLLPLIMFTAGVSMLLSSLYVRFRDVQPIWSVISQLLFYGSPVLYTVQSIGDPQLEHLYMFNPLACILTQARQWIIDPSAVSWIDAAGGFPLALVPVAIFVTVCVLGWWVFDREAPRIAELL
jgi:ABC-2 type transport system permease protein